MRSSRGRQKVDRGPTSDYVAENVRALRVARRLSQAGLSARLGELGRPMLPSALSKIEAKERGVDVDDLMALAVALSVNPNRLLLPPDASDQEIALTPKRSFPAWAVWQWADGAWPLPTQAAESEQGYNSEEEIEDFQTHGRPPELLREQRHPLMIAGMRLLLNARHLIKQSTRPTPHGDAGKAARSLEGSLVIARRRLEKYASEIDEIEEQAADRG